MNGMRTDPRSKKSESSSLHLSSIAPMSSNDQSAPSQNQCVGRDDQVKKRRRKPSSSVIANACTACQRRRTKCNGAQPCSKCISQHSPVCEYLISSKTAKQDMQREINELRQKNLLSTQILDALRSNRQVPAILDLLKDQEDLGLVANFAKSSRATPSGDTPPSAATENILQGSSDQTSPSAVTGVKQEPSPAPEQNVHRPTPSLLLIKHLLSLYWTWIHPAYPLFNMEFFIGDYMTGAEDHSSALLVAAVCAAACDLLSPPWVASLNTVEEVADLRQIFVAEVNIQENLADHSAQTSLEASQVMKLVDFRTATAESNSLKNAPQSSCGCDGKFKTDIYEGPTPSVNKEEILHWLATDDVWDSSMAT